MDYFKTTGNIVNQGISDIQSVVTDLNKNVLCSTYLTPEQESHYRQYLKDSLLEIANELVVDR